MASKTTKTIPEDQVGRKWYVVDADGLILGRLATRVATILRGKHKPQYSPNLDVGDHVVILNAKKIKATGNKLEDKIYTRYSGYPSGLKKRSLGRILETKPEYALEHAIRGMLPRNKLGRRMLKKVRIYAGADHPHEAQAPEPLEL